MVHNTFNLRMKVLFLDVDGVLHPADCTPRSSANLGESSDTEAAGSGKQAGSVPSISPGGSPGSRSSYLFQKEQMACLAKVIHATGAELVLSSAWRLAPGGVLAVNRALKQRDLPAIKDCTPTGGESRVDQIWSWLAEHRSEIEGYVVVDDSDLSTQVGRYGTKPSPFRHHFVRTPSSGLSSSHVLRIIAKMQQPPHLPAGAEDVRHATAFGALPMLKRSSTRNSSKECSTNDSPFRRQLRSSGAAVMTPCAVTAGPRSRVQRPLTSLTQSLPGGEHSWSSSDSAVLAGMPEMRRGRTLPACV